MRGTAASVCRRKAARPGLADRLSAWIERRSGAAGCVPSALRGRAA